MESYQHDSIAELVLERLIEEEHQEKMMLESSGILESHDSGLEQSGRIGGRGREAGELRGGGGRVHENKVALSWSYHFAHKLGSLFEVKLHGNHGITRRDVIEYFFGVFTRREGNEY